MGNNNIDCIDRHIKTHSGTSSMDRAAVSVLQSFLRSKGKINWDFSDTDKWPNTDGFIEFVRDPSRSRAPEKRFIVQIKGTDRYVEAAGTVKYPLKSLGFPAFVFKKITADPGILFVVFHPEEHGKERVFWKYMSPAFLAGIDFQKDSTTVYFSPEEEIKNTADSVNAFCGHLCKIIDGQTPVPDPNSFTSDIYWVGNRQSDLDGHEAQWKGFVVLFGDKHEPDNDRYVMCPKGDSRRVDHNDSSDLSQERFLARSVKEILKKDPGARFMFYNPSTAYRLVTLEFVEEKDFLEHVVCLNDQATLDEISDKASFRKMMHADDAAPGSRTVPMLPVLHRSKISCKYNDLVQAVQDGQFDDKNDYSRFDAEYGAPALRYEPEHRFVVQAPISSGGSGTFILTRQNAHYLLSSLAPRGEYLVSVYHTKNVPINMHVLIPANGPAVLLPASVQLECEVEMENKLLYKGADYAAYTQLDKHLQDQFENEVRAVADALKAAGYRGVLGVDGIVHNGRVNILEVNPRFQASTELLNRALVEKCGHTLQEMNLICFTDVPFPGDIAEACGSVSVNYSNFSFSNEDHFTHDRHVFRIASNTPGIKVQEDGYSWERQNDYIVQAYLYRLVFEGNIAGISRDGQVWINENIVPPERWLWNKINEKEKLAVKLALMLQGIRMELKLNNRLDEKAGALDLQFGSGRDLMVVNAPTNIRYAGFSPFALRESDTIPGKYVVCYYDKALIDGVGAVPGRIQNGPCDGGRQQLRVTCHFADGRSVHSFSAAVNGDEELRQFVRACRDERDQAAGGMITQQHLVLDGQALDRQQEDRLVSAVELLKDCRLPIYIQSQPLREETVRRLTQLGVTEFAYNVDVFDEACRKAYDPGRRGVREYVAGLENTRKILNGVNRSPERKAVRSRVVVGLEPEASMLEGVRRLIELHVEPALSVFHPQPGADPKVQNAPPIRLVYQLFHTVTEMLFRQNRDLDEDMIEWKKDGDDIVGTITDFHKLGPQCRCCQSDTVSLPWDLQTIRFRPTAPVVDGKRGYFSECV